MVSPDYIIAYDNRLTHKSSTVLVCAKEGTLKRGYIPSEHAVVYFTGTDPESCYLDGEQERGIMKEPIEVAPAEYSLSLRKASRIQFSKTFPVDIDVKAKDIGRVIPAHLSRLVSCWESEFYNSRGGDTWA
jgi:hypothetical protein